MASTAMSKTNFTPKDPMHVARLRLQIQDPFLGAGSLYLDLEEVTLEQWQKLAPWNSPTACTNGRKIMYYGPFVQKVLADNGQSGVDLLLAHETLHCLAGDPYRMETRHPILYNMAADYCIHDTLTEAEWVLPKLLGGVPPLYDVRFKGMSREQVYSILKQEQEDFDETHEPGGQAKKDSKGKSMPSKGKDHLKGPGQDFGVVIVPCDSDGKPLDGGQLQAEAQQWQAKAQQALDMAKACGNLKGAWERTVGEVLEPKIPWQEVLRRFIRDARNRRGEDFAWSPGNRRAISRGLHFPAVEKIGMGVLDIHVDLSGSIGPKEMDSFAAEIRGIRQDAKPELTRVIYFDTEVCRVDELQLDQELDISGVKAGGGTDFRPSFDWVTETHQAPACAVVLTDLCCDSYADQPPYEVLWVSTVVGSKAKWGQTLELSLE